MLRLVFVSLLFLVGGLVAANRPDFSGSYLLTKTTGDFQAAKGTVWALDVIQSAATITVTKVRSGRSFANTFSLDGTEGVYSDPTGIVGKCKGHYKGRELYLDLFVTTQLKGGPFRIEGHTTERWELSQGSRTLTIQTEVRTTDADTKEVMPNNIKPWSEIYQRN